MDIDLARTFLAIVETGNFNRAAERLNVTQSTVSMRVKALEDLLSRSLFVRSKSGTKPTAAGVQFRRYATTLVRAWEQARQEVALPQHFQAVLSIGGQFTLWDQLLLRWIPWVRRAVPDMAVRAEVGLSDGLMRQVMEGLLDIAVMYTPQSRPGLTIEELLRQRLVLVASSPDSAAPRDAGYVFVDWGPEFLAGYSHAYPDLETPALSVSHGPLGLQHILDNGGSGYFPLRTIAPYLKQGGLHRVPGAHEFERPVYMVYPTDRDDARFRTALDGLRHVASLAGEE